MNALKNLYSKHKRASLFALFALIVFVGCSAVSAVNVAQKRAQESSPQTEQSTTEQVEVDGTTSGDSGMEDVKLTESQESAIDSYDDETKALIETLSASVWSANGGRNVIRFYDDQFVETSGGKSIRHSYAITRLEKNADTSGAEVDSIVFETDDGTHIVTYSQLTGTSSNGTGKITSTLSSSTMFSLKGTDYERVDAVEKITIKGLNSEMTDIFGGDTTDLTDELSAWCAVNYPTATEATWENIAIIDYDSNTVSTNFTLNTETKISIAALYHTDTGTFDFSY